MANYKLKYTGQQIDNLLTKIDELDLNNYYDKIETNELLAAKQDKLTAGTGINITDNVISATIEGISYEFYDTYEELPEEGEVGVFYLIPNGETGANTYDEYLWIPTKSGYEFIGTTSIDLSDYPTLDGNNTFTGENTFTNPIKLTASHNTYIYADGNNFKVKLNNVDSLVYTTSAFVSLDGTDLGSTTRKWKDLHLSGTAYLPVIEDDTAISFKINGTERFKIQGAEMLTGKMYPSIDNTFDLGTKTYKYKNLNLAGVINPNDNGYGLSLPDSTGLIANSEIVDTGSAQMIVGEKTFSPAIYLQRGSLVKRFITSLPTTANLGFGRGSGDIDFEMSSSALAPYTNNNKDLGTSTQKFKDLYLNGNAFIDTTKLYSANTNFFINLNSSANDDYAFYSAAFVGVGGNKNLGTNANRWNDIYFAGVAYCGSLSPITTGKNIGASTSRFNAVFANYGNFSIHAVTPQLKSATTGDYGINVPDTTGYTANRTLATIEQPYASNSTTQLEYATINNISISADTTFTLATAPTGTYPEYNANITNTDTVNAITITLPSGTIVKAESIITVSSNTFEIPADTTVIVNIQDALALVMIKG